MEKRFPGLLDRAIDEMLPEIEVGMEMDPETLRVGADRVRSFVAAEPRLAPYRHELEVLLRRAAHTLDDAGEALVARFAPTAGAAGSSTAIKWRSMRSLMSIWCGSRQPSISFGAS